LHQPLADLQGVQTGLRLDSAGDGILRGAGAQITADGLGREEDYYQLLAYLAAFNQDEGLLIYCQHDGTAPAGEVVVRNLHKRLRTWAIRLDRSPQHIEQELAVLADHIVKRALKDPATSSNNAGTSKTLAQHA
jgi:hypothetical protein